jgi:hypothetical protein
VVRNLGGADVFRVAVGVPERLTRRTVLAGAAAAGAASIVSPAAGLADALGQRRPVFSHWIGTLERDSGALAVGRRFALVGVEWAGPAPVRIELRTRARGGAWSRWVLASVLGHAPDGPQRRALQSGEGIWTGLADEVQLRTSDRVHGVRLVLVSVPSTLPGEDAARAAGALPLAQPVLDAGPGQPPIIARSAWAHGGAKPAVTPSYGVIKLAFVHHTENPNGYSAAEVPAMLLAIYQFHRYGRGWNDIGYNFVIDAFGRIWEARAGGIDQAVIGAQAGGYNAVSTGVAVLGSFMDAVPSSAALAALRRLLAWKLSLHGVPVTGKVTVEVDPADAFYTPFPPGAHVSLPRVAGHRDGDSTDCPGNAFYARLPALRTQIEALTGTPAKLTLIASRAEATAPAAITLSGTAKLFDGTPLASAPIELQQLTAAGEQTIATLTTDAGGGWTTELTLEHSLLVRALHRPAPASASDLIELAIAPVVTLEAAPGNPVAVSGTVAPAKPAVTIDVYAVSHGHRQLVMSKRLPVRQGSFDGRLRIRRSGRYALRARTALSASSAAAASPAVSVRV